MFKIIIMSSVLLGYSVHYDAEQMMDEEEQEDARPRRPQRHPSLVTPSHQILPFKQPLALNKFFPDAALFKSRGFRLSWGPESRLLQVQGLSISLSSPYKQTPTFKVS